MAEMQRELRVASVHGIHQDLGKIEKCVMRVDLRSERAGSVEIDLIFDHCAVGGALNLPAALVELADDEWFAGAVPGSDPVHVLREIANLVQGVPHWQLQLANG